MRWRVNVASTMTTTTNSYSSSSSPPSSSSSSAAAAAAATAAAIATIATIAANAATTILASSLQSSACIGRGTQWPMHGLAKPPLQRTRLASHRTKTRARRAFIYFHPVQSAHFKRPNSDSAPPTFHASPLPEDDHARLCDHNIGRESTITVQLGVYTNGKRRAEFDTGYTPPTPLATDTSTSCFRMDHHAVLQKNHHYVGRTLLWKAQGSIDAAEAVVEGWMPAAVSSFVDPSTGAPSRVWVVRFSSGPLKGDLSGLTEEAMLQVAQLPPFPPQHATEFCCTGRPLIDCEPTPLHSTPLHSTPLHSTKFPPSLQSDPSRLTPLAFALDLCTESWYTGGRRACACTRHIIVIHGGGSRGNSGNNRLRGTK